MHENENQLELLKREVKQKEQELQIIMRRIPNYENDHLTQQMNREISRLRDEIDGLEKEQNAMQNLVCRLFFFSFKISERNLKCDKHFCGIPSTVIYHKDWQGLFYFLLAEKTRKKKVL